MQPILHFRSIPHQCLRFVTEAEGTKLEMYLDSAKKPTIGTGHLITAREHFPGKITLKQSHALLRSDLASAAMAVEHYVKVALNENEYSALISFTFNVGVGNLRRSTLLKLLNSGNRKDAARHFAQWNKVHVGSKLIEVPGLTERRAAEAALFSKPVITPRPSVPLATPTASPVTVPTASVVTPPTFATPKRLP